MSTTEVRHERWRLITKAHAANVAAAADECPLGYEKPCASMNWPTSGRLRSTTSFKRFVATLAPAMATSRKIAVPQRRVRIVSTIATTAAMITTPAVLPRSVSQRRTLVVDAVPWSAAHRAIERSKRTTAELVRTSKASTPTPITSKNATVSANPVSSRTLVRSRAKRRSASCLRIPRSTARAVPCTGPREIRSPVLWTPIDVTTATVAAPRPTRTRTIQMSTRTPNRSRYRGCARSGVSRTVEPESGRRHL